MKKYWPIITIGVVIVAVIGGVIYFQTSKTYNNKNDLSGSKKTTTKKPINIEFTQPICDQVPASVVAKALNTTIKKTVPTTGSITNICKYYLADGSYINIRLNKLNYETQKIGNADSGAKVGSSSAVKAENFTVTPPTGELHSVVIKVYENLILTVERGSAATLSDKQIISIASNVVSHLQSKKVTSSSGSNSGSSNNSGSSVTKNDDTRFINQFFSYITRGRASQAVMMMTSKNTSDDSTKQSWGVQFNAMKSLKVINISPINKDSWTDTSHQYKVVFDVIMDPNSRNATIPYYGYNNGQNIRYITLEKEDGAWRVSEIATGP